MSHPAPQALCGTPFKIRRNTCFLSSSTSLLQVLFISNISFLFLAVSFCLEMASFSSPLCGGLALLQASHKRRRPTDYAHQFPIFLSFVWGYWNLLFWDQNRQAPQLGNKYQGWDMQILKALKLSLKWILGLQVWILNKTPLSKTSDFTV